MKRNNYISWDSFFMGLAELAAQRSKDPSTQVGACIVGKDNEILSVGYNGFPRGCSDETNSWEREGEFLETKYAKVCHAELNSILLRRGSVQESRLYVTLFPCNECAKAIIQSGITEVVYKDDKYAESDSTKVAKALFDEANIKYRKYESEGKVIELKL